MQDMPNHMSLFIDPMADDDVEMKFFLFIDERFINLNSGSFDSMPSLHSILHA